MYTSRVPALMGMASLPTGNLYVRTGVRKVGSSAEVTPKDLFHLGSNTQAMTATVVAIFVEKGLLTWDSYVVSFFPELTSRVHPDFANLTVKLLSAHHSGITKEVKDFNNGQLWKALRDPHLQPSEGRKLVAREVLTHPPASKPGTYAENSNFNYAILGAILEKVGGYPWETIINAELFKPLGMHSCGFGSPAQFPDQPWGHKHNNNSHAFEAEVPHDNPSALAPGGGVHCSLEDWGKFVRYHIDGYNGKNVFPHVNFPILHSEFQKDAHTIGGWIIKDRWGGVAFNHSGSNTMYYALVFVAPVKETAILVVANAGGEAAKTACNDGLKAFLEALP